MSATPVLIDKMAYSVNGAGKVIGLSRSTVWRLIHDGELRTFKIGGRTLIRADVLAAFIDRKSASAA